jgi:ADP-ribosylglycohydrolase
VEFDSLETIRERFGPRGIVDLEPAYGRRGAITDDTQMSLFTAEGLVLAARTGAMERRSELTRHVHRAYLRWLRTQGRSSAHPTFSRSSEGWLLDIGELHARRAPGNTCLAALELDRLGSPEQPFNQSKGCGGVMRAAPVGLIPGLGDPFRTGCDVAAITHGHPSGYLAAGAFATMIREVAGGASLEEAAREALEELGRWPSHQECSEALGAALDCASQGPPGPEIVESLGGGWVAEEALAISLYCALRGQQDFRKGVLLAVNHSGDSDSTGAITGNLLGALLGTEGIPRDWLQQVELRAVIERVADELVGACRSRAASGAP